MTFSVDNIRSLTDFRRRTKDYVSQLRETNAPLILTVNGEAALVVQNAQAFQSIQDRLQKAEDELQALKLATLNADLQAGIHQLETEQYTTYTESTAQTLADKIKSKGRSQRRQASAKA